MNQTSYLEYDLLKKIVGPIIHRIMDVMSYHFRYYTSSQHQDIFFHVDVNHKVNKMRTNNWLLLFGATGVRGGENNNYFCKHGKFTIFLQMTHYLIMLFTNEWWVVPDNWLHCINCNARISPIIIHYNVTEQLFFSVNHKHYTSMSYFWNNQW